MRNCNSFDFQFPESERISGGKYGTPVGHRSTPPKFCVMSVGSLTWWPGVHPYKSNWLFSSTLTSDVNQSRRAILICWNRSKILSNRIFLLFFCLFSSRVARWQLVFWLFEFPCFKRQEAAVTRWLRGVWVPMTREWRPRCVRTCISFRTVEC